MSAIGYLRFDFNLFTSNCHPKSANLSKFAYLRHHDYFRCQQKYIVQLLVLLQ